eukprot:scaffold15019_cov177-Isochrysis_galbana.AAC.1
MTKAASGWLIGEPIISSDPSVRDVFEMEVVVPRAIIFHCPLGPPNPLPVPSLPKENTAAMAKAAFTFTAPVEQAPPPQTKKKVHSSLNPTTFRFTKESQATPSLRGYYYPLQGAT